MLNFVNWRKLTQRETLDVVNFGQLIISTQELKPMPTRVYPTCFKQIDLDGLYEFHIAQTDDETDESSTILLQLWFPIKRWLQFPFQMLISLSN